MTSCFDCALYILIVMFGRTGSNYHCCEMVSISLSNSYTPAIDCVGYYNASPHSIACYLHSLYLICGSKFINMYIDCYTRKDQYLKIRMYCKQSMYILETNRLTYIWLVAWDHADMTVTTPHTPLPIQLHLRKSLALYVFDVRPGAASVPAWCFSVSNFWWVFCTTLARQYRTLMRECANVYRTLYNRCIKNLILKNVAQALEQSGLISNSWLTASKVIDWDCKRLKGCRWESL